MSLFVFLCSELQRQVKYVICLTQLFVCVFLYVKSHKKTCIMKMLHAKFQYAHWRYVLDRTPKIIPQNPSQSLQLEQKVERFHTNLSGFRWLRGKNTCFRQLDTYTRQINACVCKWAIRVAGYIFLLEEGVVTDNTFPLAAINPLLDRWSVKCNSVLLAKTNVESLCRPSPLP